VRARVDEAVALAAAELTAWGCVATPRALPDAEPLSPGALALQAYEAGRPSAAQACRIGDARFLAPVPTAPPGGGA
jgi:hydrogenase maturation protease